MALPIRWKVFAALERSMKLVTRKDGLAAVADLRGHTGEARTPW
jgi:hypothetical protein